MNEKQTVWFVAHQNSRKGVFPVHRNGWLLVGGYMLSFVLAGLLLLAWQTVAGFLAFAAVIVFSSWAYFSLRRKHTDFENPQSTFKGARHHALNKESSRSS